MNQERNPFTEPISDETACALSEALHWLALACETQYFGQIRRYRATLDEARPIDPEQPWNPYPPAE